jgi:hypothetical protein
LRIRRRALGLVWKSIQPSYSAGWSQVSASLAVIRRAVGRRPAGTATPRPSISDPYARFQQAEKMKRAEMIKNTKTYWVPWETIHERNPQQILDRREKVSLPPLLIMQGALDDNVLPSLQEKFAAS